MRRNYAAFLLMSACASCSTGAGPSGVEASFAPSAAAINYALPAASPKLTMQLVLLQCKQGPLVTPVIAVTNEAVADPTRRHRLSGYALSSALQKRELAVDLYENGTLKSVNASVEDRTGAVITNVFSLLTGGLGLARALGVAGGGGNICNKQTQDALDEVAATEARIASLRKVLLTASPSDAEKLQKQIDALAARVGNLRANDLTVSVSRPLDLKVGVNSPQTIRWSMEDLSKWFAPNPVTAPCNQHAAFQADPAKLGCEAETALFAVTYQFAGTPASDPERADRCAMGAIAPADAGACERTIAIVEPVRAKVIIKPVGDDFAGKRHGETLAESGIVVPQWGTVAYLPLQVGFAGSKNVAFALSPFGSKTSFQWKSQARAESATAALSSIVTGASGLVTAARAPDTSQVAEWQRQITELETQMKLNKLIKCQATIQAGGTTCPDS